MQQALRPFVTAGVAIVGAGLIAVIPVAASLPELQQHAVALTATGAESDVLPVDLIDPLIKAVTAIPADQPYPLTSPADVVSTTIENVDGLVKQVVSDPAPILDQVVTNWLGYANDMVTAVQTSGSNLVDAVEELPTLLNGNLYDVITNLWSYELNLPFAVGEPLVGGVFEVLRGMASNLAELLGPSSYIAAGGTADFIIPAGTLVVPPEWLHDLVVAPLYGPNAAIYATAGVLQDVLDAAGSGHLATALADAFYGPSTIVGAFLNGYPVNLGGSGTSGPAYYEAAVNMLLPRILNPEYGLLSSQPAGGGLRALTAGTLQSLLDARVIIAEDLGAGEKIAPGGPYGDSAVQAVQADVIGTLHGGALDVGKVVSDLAAALDAGSLTAALNPADWAGLVDPSLVGDISAFLLNLLP